MDSVNTGIDYFTHERYGVPSMYRDNALTIEDKGTYCTDISGREALSFLESTGDQPFLLYLPFDRTDRPRWTQKSAGTVQAPDEYKAMYPPVETEFIEKARYGKKALTPTPEARQRDYRAALTCMDANIGHVLDWLDQHHKAENTLVIFFSDNGGSGGADNEPLRGHKSQMFEGGVRVPCIIRWPGHVPAGKVSDAFSDVPGSCADHSRCDQHGLHHSGHKLDGHDMMPVLAEGKPSPRDRMTWVRQGDQAVRWQHYKWIRTPKEEYLSTSNTISVRKKTSQNHNPPCSNKCGGFSTNGRPRWSRQNHAVRSGISEARITPASDCSTTLKILWLKPHLRRELRQQRPPLCCIRFSYAFGRFAKKQRSLQVRDIKGKHWTSGASTP